MNICERCQERNAQSGVPRSRGAPANAYAVLARGAAQESAREQYGAAMGVGNGRTGNAYAIPTMALPLKRIEAYIDAFREYARDNPDLRFQVTQIGCGIAGFEAKDIAPMFKGFPLNVLFDEAWEPYLDDDANVWGSYHGPGICSCCPTLLARIAIQSAGILENGKGPQCFSGVAE